MIMFLTSFIFIADKHIYEYYETNLICIYVYACAGVHACNIHTCLLLVLQVVFPNQFYLLHPKCLSHLDLITPTILMNCEAPYSITYLLS
jgi:hypothetical protein